MLFTSTVFLFLFFPVLLILYYLPFVGRKGKNLMLFAASIIFYAYGEPIYVALMLISITVTYLLGLMIGKLGGYRRVILTIGIIYHIGVLFVFKYLSFFVNEFLRVTAVLGNIYSEYADTTNVIKIALPLGISFFTFQMMSYLFDIYYSNAEYDAGLLNVGLYVSLFPQLIAGPIVRYSTISGAIRNRRENLQDFSYGVWRFAVGVGKKVLIADSLGIVVDAVFSSSTVASIAMVNAWIGSIAYTFQIYFDFSGYSDMAIGLGRCFGFHFDENFNYPYIAESVTDFWKRWHISLTNWFRDYVYIPMGGNRVKKSRHVFNVFIVWLLTGIWHGANWTFLLWGMIYFMLMIGERYVYQTTKMPVFLRHLYTILVVNLAWTLFRSDSIADFGRMFRAMLGFNGFSDMNSGAYISNSLLIIIVAAVGATPLINKVHNWIMTGKHKLAYVFEWIIVTMGFMVAVAAAINHNYSPFLYFNF